MTEPAIPQVDRRIVAAVAAGCVVMTLLLGWLAAAIAVRAELYQQRQQLQVDVTLQRELLRSELERHQLLPIALASDPSLSLAVDAAARPDERADAIERLNARFEMLGQRDGSATLYLIGADGRTVAASNYRTPGSFIGQDYSFRPYFRDAIASGVGEFFAQGTVSGVPGLYLAQRLDDATGVIVVKVEFTDLERSWAANPGRTEVVGDGGDVLLSTDPDRRFQRARLDLPPAAGELRAVAAIPEPRWTLVVARDVRSATRAARANGWIVGLLAGAVVSLALWVLAVVRTRRLRIRQALEAMVVSRTAQLDESNRRLQQEIDDRTRSEARLQQLRIDLAQANRLAVLGQISAGVAHEINQPVAAIRTYVDSAQTLLERGRHADVLSNLGQVATLTERISLITNELRTFARKAPDSRERVQVNEALDGALLLLDALLKTRRVRMERHDRDAKVVVVANRIRLEQVLVNLLQNAIDALQDVHDPCIRIDVEQAGQQAVIVISDNGPGVPPEQLAELFTPFVSSKPMGLGLGLVICRDILADYGATLDYSRAEIGGARFRITFGPSAP